MNTSLCRKLFVVAAAMNPKFCCKLFYIHPFHFRNVLSTLANIDAHSHNIFADFASSKLNMSEADITRIFKLAPSLQRLQTLHNVEQSIHMFNRHGFSQVQIAKIMRAWPSVIALSAEKVIEPKIKLLENLGFEGQILTKLLTMNSHILKYSLENDLLPKMEFLKNVFKSQDVLIKALLRAPQLLTNSLEKTLKPSLAFWEGWGFCETELYRFLQIYPAVLSRTSLTPGQADLIHNIGADKGSKTFKYILSIVTVSRMETLEAKIQNLKLCGLSAEETWQVFRTAPSVFTCSKENISAKMNFVVNNMELPANYVVKHPWLLQINLEKIMKPRFLVWQRIKSINDLGLHLLTVLMMREVRFVRKIIKGHPESKTLWTIYENAISNASSRTKQTLVLD